MTFNKKYSIVTVLFYIIQSPFVLLFKMLLPDFFLFDLALRCVIPYITFCALFICFVFIIAGHSNFIGPAIVNASIVLISIFLLK